MKHYITEPIEKFVVKKHNAESNYTTTEYICPLCGQYESKRRFHEHVLRVHSHKKDELYARLFGLSYPVLCKCGKELHFNDSYKGFPKTCGNCANSVTSASPKEYRNASEAHIHVERLKEMLAMAQAEEARMKKEEELDRVPIESLPFPSFKYVHFMRRLSRMIRVHAANGAQDKLFELSNMIDSRIQ